MLFRSKRKGLESRLCCQLQCCLRQGCLELARDVHEICPQAWVINFTNPAGIVTEIAKLPLASAEAISCSQNGNVSLLCCIPNGQEMDVTLMYPEEQRSKIEDLHDMKIQTPQGATISLDELAEFKQMSGPVSLQRENQQPQMNVSSQIVDRDLGTITQDVEKTLAGMELPEGYNYEIGGQAN